MSTITLDQAVSLVRGYMSRPPKDMMVRDVWDVIQAHLAQPVQNKDAQVVDGWRCFHCDEQFTDPQEAELHFGINETREPACHIGITAIRQMQHDLDRYRDGDGDKDREMIGMGNRHAQALRREEEIGYARGVRDAQTVDGWKWVPIKPTVEMLDKGTAEHECEQCDPHYNAPALTDYDAIAIYKAMLSASPAPGKDGL